MSALEICVELLHVHNSHIHLLHIDRLTLQHTEKGCHASWPAQMQQILCILDVSDPLNVWASPSVYQEYVQYIIKMMMMDPFAGVHKALLLPRMSLGLSDMQRWWIWRDPSATINAGLYSQEFVSVWFLHSLLAYIDRRKDNYTLFWSVFFKNEATGEVLKKAAGAHTFISGSCIHLGAGDVSCHTGEAWRYLRDRVGVIILFISGGQIHTLITLVMLFRWFTFLWQHFMSYVISPVKNNFIMSFVLRKKLFLRENSFCWTLKEINTFPYLHSLGKSG